MIGKDQLKLTEWDWFRLQCRVHAIEREGKYFITRYTFPESKDSIAKLRFPMALVECSFWCKTTDDLLMRKAPRAEHLEYYPGWVASEKEQLRRILQDLPSLSRKLDLEKNVLFTILHNYGMGSAIVCHFYGRRVHWAMSVKQIPE